MCLSFVMIFHEPPVGLSQALYWLGEGVTAPIIFLQPFGGRNEHQCC